MKIRQLDYCVVTTVQARPLNLQKPLLVTLVARPVVSTLPLLYRYSICCACIVICHRLVRCRRRGKIEPGFGRWRYIRQDIESSGGAVAGQAHRQLPQRMPCRRSVAMRVQYDGLAWN
jgi:hypothetical protein